MSFIFFSLFTLSSSAFAESCPNFQAGFDVDKIVSAIAPVARDNLHRAIGEDGKNLAKETAAEKAKPLLTKEQMNCAVFAGLDSAEAEFCKLDYKQLNYAPFMLWLRKQINNAERPAAYAGILHGIASQTFKQAFVEKQTTCADARKESLKKRLEGLWKK